MRLAARMKLLFIAAINHIYCCNSWRPTRSHNPTEVSVTDVMDTEKTHLLKVICISWQNLQPQLGRQMCLFVRSSSDGRSCLHPHPGSHQVTRLWLTGGDPSAHPCCCPCCWQGDCGCVSQRTGFVSFLGDEGFQFGDQNPNQPSSGCSVSCANKFTQSTVANKRNLYLLAPASVCLLGLLFLPASVHLTYPMGKN